MIVAVALALSIATPYAGAQKPADKPALSSDSSAQASSANSNNKPKLDYYGDPLPPHAVARLGTPKFRGTEPLYQVVVGPGGKQIFALQLWTPAVIMWDAETGEEIRRFEGAKRLVREYVEPTSSFSFTSFALSPDGKLLAVATDDFKGGTCPLILFDVPSGRKLAELTVRMPHRWAAPYSPGSLAFLTSERLVSTDTECTVRIWDVSRRAEIRQLSPPPGSKLHSVTASPDGKYISITGLNKQDNNGNRAPFWTVWEAASGKLVYHEDLIDRIWPWLGFSPDGKMLAVVTSKSKPMSTEFRLFSISDWKEQHKSSHDGPNAPQSAIVFSPDGKIIAACGADYRIRRWDVVTLKEIGTAIDADGCQGLAFLNADTLLTFGDRLTVGFWDVASGKRKDRFAGPSAEVFALAFSGDGRRIAVGAGRDNSTIDVYEAPSGKLVESMRRAALGFQRLQFSPDDKQIISIDSSANVSVWTEGKKATKVGNSRNRQNAWWSANVSPDGQSVATIDESHCVKIWSNRSGDLIKTLNPWTMEMRDSKMSVAFTADGRSVVASSRHDVYQWDLASGENRRFFKASPQYTAVNWIGASPTCRWIYVLGYDGSICAWDVDRMTLAATIQGSQPELANCEMEFAISPNGARLAAGIQRESKNAQVCVYDLASGRKAALSGHSGGITAFGFSPDSRYLVSVVKRKTPMFFGDFEQNRQ
jgi:WD40 repeat protein